LTPTKNKILEEQAIRRGANCHANISYEFESFSNLHGLTLP